MINAYIAALAAYGLKTGLITADDRIFAINSILAALGLDDYEEPENIPDMELEEILKGLLDFACSKNIIPDSIAYRDLFDTKLMACLTPRPSEVIAKFKADYAVSPVTATDNYYKLSRDTDYIRRYRIAKDIKWKTETEYGELDITINLSKPEKDPKAIAAKERQAERLSQVPAVSRECGLCGPPQSPCTPEPQNYPCRYLRRAMGLPVLPLRLLQRALHSFQHQAHSYGHRQESF